ncbi:MAG: hypothetical protein JW807_14955 [Spirochaetes bacterium]|nr:hypothetical protein [Spirochaetota bacterium]
MNSKWLGSACALALAFSGCSVSLIREPACLSKERWDLTIVALTLGPDQYATPGDCRVPPDGRGYVWATVTIRNRLKTDQVFSLDRILLRAGGKKIKPYIIDMDIPVTIRANPSPRLRPGETVSRKLIYAVPRGLPAEKMVYENTDLIIPGAGEK